ncbi:hypothetical protein H6784_02985 [Candidatus Nomurabacteria bacterium]|nr:hypothetical protein [Candidatus Kaiserbacteria bacterium]MCB9814358.1 hypothetical protein [Candidatus Nomurabacteria bacterium]
MKFESFKFSSQESEPSNDNLGPNKKTPLHAAAIFAASMAAVSPTDSMAADQAQHIDSGTTHSIEESRQPRIVVTVEHAKLGTLEIAIYNDRRGEITPGNTYGDTVTINGEVQEIAKKRSLRNGSFSYRFANGDGISFTLKDGMSFFTKADADAEEAAYNAGAN